MTTIKKSASVKVMLSYDYCHFESSMTLENEIGLTNKEIDEARKECQRLAYKAAGQYRTAKEMAAKRSDGKFQIQNFQQECERIKKKDEHDRTLKEIGMLKQFEDENWQSQFDYEYDYNDDDNYNI